MRIFRVYCIYKLRDNDLNKNILITLTIKAILGKDNKDIKF